MPCLQN